MICSLSKFIPLVLILFVLNGLLQGCASNKSDAPDFGGDWVALNVYADTIDTIPRSTPYLFRASKLDGSLIGLLQRWSRDSKSKLFLTCQNDYTLPAIISSLSAVSIEDAVVGINQIYSEQRVHLTVDLDKSLSFRCGAESHPKVVPVLGKVIGVSSVKAVAPKK